jgi:uncharacterized protein with HEPN domain
MKAEIKKHLYDILQSAEEIIDFTSTMDLQAYETSAVTQRAVERDFGIIGEALSRIKRTDERILDSWLRYGRQQNCLECC